MSKIVHIIGNGPTSAMTYDPNVPGDKYTCNLPPFPVPGAKATFMVDFKMMNAITLGELQVPGEWIVGMRPKKWCESRPNFYLKFARQIKEFFLEKPPYVANYTDFNCGHMGVYYIAKKLKADEIHMYGFDSIFDFDLRSCTDFYLGSDRSTGNNARLTGNWRPVWNEMFKEFKNTKFILYHKHNNIKLNIPDNVEIKVINKNTRKIS